MFAVLFGVLGVPEEHRHKVLVLGIALAIVLRAIFIFVGIAAIDAFHGVTYGLGVLLAITAISVARGRRRDRDPTESRVMKLVNRVVPDGAPPLMLPLVAVGAFDVMFAIDSIPAIFAVTTDTFVVLAANAWSLCGMISLFFLLENALQRFRYLHYGLAVILGYVAAKLILVDVWHPPIVLSLVVVVLSLVVAALASFIVERAEEDAAPDTAPESARAPRGTARPTPGTGSIRLRSADRRRRPPRRRRPRRRPRRRRAARRRRPRPRRRPCARAAARARRRRSAATARCARRRRDTRPTPGAPPTRSSASRSPNATPSSTARTSAPRSWRSVRPVNAPRASGSACGVRSPAR